MTSPCPTIVHRSAGRPVTGAAPGRPLVSVVITTFNRRRMLEETIRSYEAQSWPNLEIVVIDDGSSDDTLAFLADWEARPSARGFRWAQQRNSGAGPARNTGLSLIAGDYVKFEDDDDTAEPGLIEAFVSMAERTGADLCVGSRQYMGPDGAKYGINYSPPSGPIANPAVRFFDLELVPLTGLWFFRRQLFLAGYEWRNQIREDTDILSRMLIGGAKVAGAPDAILNYRVAGAGRLSEKIWQPEEYAKVLRSFEAVGDEMLSRGSPDDVREAFAASLSRTAVRLWGINRGQSLATYRLARKVHPRHRLTGGRLFADSRVLKWLATTLWSVGGLYAVGPAFACFSALRRWRQRLRGAG